MACKPQQGYWGLDEDSKEEEINRYIMVAASMLYSMHGFKYIPFNLLFHFILLTAQPGLNYKLINSGYNQYPSILLISVLQRPISRSLSQQYHIVMSETAASGSDIEHQRRKVVLPAVISALMLHNSQWRLSAFFQTALYHLGATELV